MSRPRKSKTSFVYALQVWLTSALIGSIYLFWYVQHKDTFGTNFIEDLAAYGEILLYASLYSIPSFVLLFAGVSLLNRLRMQPAVKRLIFAVLALVLDAFALELTFYLIGSDVEFPWEIFVAFGLPLVAAVFLFRLPQKKVSDPT